MAKASLVSTIDAITGHTGSLQFSLGTSGAFISNTTRPRRSLTPKQHAAGAAWTNMVKAWRNATTPAERSDWGTFGAAHGTSTKCGSTVQLPGFQAFARTNTRLLHIGRPLQTSPPSTFTSPSPGACTGTYSPGPPPTLQITPTNAPSSSQVPIVYGTGPRLAGWQADAKRTVTLAILAAGTPGPYDVAAQWAFIFGQIKTGQQITLSLRYVDFTSGATSDRISAIIRP